LFLDLARPVLSLTRVTMRAFAMIVSLLGLFCDDDDEDTRYVCDDALSTQR